MTKKPLKACPELQIMSYNIHKGFDTRKKDFVLDEIKKSIDQVSADIVFLQEVVGSSGMGSHESQFEFIADKVWDHHSYGKNAVSSSGHHGNAILSKFPFIFTKNVDLSVNRVEKRGMIHAIIKIPECDTEVHLLCTHLNLLERDRKKQVEIIKKYINEHIPPYCHLIMAGDFNDWRNIVTDDFCKNLGLKESFTEANGDCARTFPSKFPLLRLDRIYFKNLGFIDARRCYGEPWDKLSDHLALLSRFRL